MLNILRNNRARKKRIQAAPAIKREEGRKRTWCLLDNDPKVFELVSNPLVSVSFEVGWEGSLAAFRSALPTLPAVDVALINLENPLEVFFELIPHIKSLMPDIEVICISKLAEERLWMESIQRDAYDLLPQPMEKSELY